MVHHDTDLYDLAIKAKQRTTIIHTTRHHLFFDETSHLWVEAARINYGDLLRSPAGVIATVTGGHTPESTGGWMWDLSVPGGNDHDFYIVTITAAVLVHNCSYRYDPPKWKRCISNLLIALHIFATHTDPTTVISRPTEITAIIRETKKSSTTEQGPGDGDGCGT
jgi:hypothetical protein